MASDDPSLAETRHQVATNKALCAKGLAEVRLGAAYCPAHTAAAACWHNGLHQCWTCRTRLNRRPRTAQHLNFHDLILRCSCVCLQWRRSHPAKASPAALVRDVAALTLSGSYFYYVWGLGPLPQELQQHAWVLQQQRPLQQGVALVLLVAVFLAVFVLAPRR